MAVKAALTGANGLPGGMSEQTKLTRMTYEERRMLVKSRQEALQQKRLDELLQAQRSACEMFERLQAERKRRIEELRLREEERRKAVLARREQLLVSYKERAEQLLRKQTEREPSRIRRPSSMPAKSSASASASACVSARVSPLPSDQPVSATMKRDNSTPCFRRLHAGAGAAPIAKQPMRSSRRSQSAELAAGTLPDTRGRGLKRAHSPVKSASSAGRSLVSDDVPAKSKQRPVASSNPSFTVVRLAQGTEIKLSKTAPNQMPTIVTLQTKQRIPVSASMQKLSPTPRSPSDSRRVGLPHSTSLQFASPVAARKSAEPELHADVPVPVPVPVVRPRYRSDSHTVAVAMGREPLLPRALSTDCAPVNVASVILPNCKAAHDTPNDENNSSMNVTDSNAMNLPGQNDADANRQAQSSTQHADDNSEQQSVEDGAVTRDKAPADDERVERRRRLDLIMSRVNRLSTGTPSPIDASKTLVTNQAQLQQLTSKQPEHEMAVRERDPMAASCIVPAECQPESASVMSNSFSGNGSLFAADAPHRRLASANVGVNAFKSPLLQSLFEKNGTSSGAATAGADSDIKRRLPMLLKSLSQSKATPPLTDGLGDSLPQRDLAADAGTRHSPNGPAPSEMPLD